MKYNIYFGTYASNIYYGEFCSTTGEIKITGKSPEILNPSYLCLSGNILYAVSENQDGEVVSIDLRENKITSTQKTNGAHPCHLWVNKDLLLVANYSSGSLSIFNLENNGKILESSKSIVHYGRSITSRQEKSHIHYVKNIAGESFAVCDLGLDKIFIYHRIYNIIELDCPAGSGPRHFVSSGETLYVNAELSNKILVFKDNILIQEISTLPEDFAGSSTTAAIKISPCQNYLGVSNRGHNSIAYYKIEQDGILKIIDYIKVGDTPRDFAFSPDGGWLLSASQKENIMQIFKIEKNNIIDTKKTAEVPSPVCVFI